MSDTTNTCLFTGEPLTEDTQREHTIPRKLGGRIVSREVSSSDFNTKCGASIDSMLVGRYQFLMHILGPMLARGHQTGKQEFDIEGSEDTFVSDRRGVLSPKGVKVTAQHRASGKPTGMAAKDAKVVAEYLKAAWPEADEADIKFSYLAPDEGAIKAPPVYVIHPDFEIAVLKAGLLTFDCLLRDSPFRFTRHHALAPLIQSVRSKIMDGTDAKDIFHRCSLGLQYEKGPQYRRIREEVAYKSTEFEHVLIASANPVTRTLDMVVWLFSTDPYGFRLCSNWKDIEFTFVVVNGVLKGSGYSNVIEIPNSSTLCAPTQRCAVPFEAISRRTAAVVERQVFENWKITLGRGFYYTRMHSDWLVRKELWTYALPRIGEAIELIQVIRAKLRQMYARRAAAEDGARLFDECLAQWLRDVPGEITKIVISDEKQLEALPWPTIIVEYRRALEALRVKFGDPGEFRFETLSGTNEAPATK